MNDYDNDTAWTNSDNYSFYDQVRKSNLTFFLLNKKD